MYRPYPSVPMPPPPNFRPILPPPPHYIPPPPLPNTLPHPEYYTKQAFQTYGEGELFDVPIIDYKVIPQTTAAGTVIPGIELILPNVIAGGDPRVVPQIRPQSPIMVTNTTPRLTIPPLPILPSRSF